MNTMKDKILKLIYERYPQLHYPHEREYLADKILSIFKKNKTGIKKLSNKFLADCDQKAYNADPLEADYVIKDLKKKINTLTNHIRKIQES